MMAQKGSLSGLKKTQSGTEDFDSILERDYMLELESLSGVKSWTKRHRIKIPYIFFGVKKNYLPDFLVTFQNDSQEIHETKGAGFLSWLTTHAKRTAGDKWCKERNMKYIFIENSRGATFANNNYLENVTKEVKKYNNIMDLISDE
jgi:hypothetical protein